MYFAGDTPITKRDTMKTHHAWISEEEEAEHLSKAVLLHSLGNGALERSKSHLLRHVVPNSGHHIWRRAALDALRHFNCQEASLVHEFVFLVFIWMVILLDFLCDFFFLGGGFGGSLRR